MRTSESRRPRRPRHEGAGVEGSERRRVESRRPRRPRHEGAGVEGSERRRVESRRAIVALGVGAAVALSVVSADRVLADAVVLDDGTRIEGSISVRERDLLIETVSGEKRTIAWDEVASIREDPAGEGIPPSGPRADALAEELGAKMAALPSGDAEAAVELARWADERGLLDRATELWRKAVEADPGHAEARGVLGEVEVDGVWRDALEVHAERRAELGDGPKTKELLKLADWFGKRHARAAHYRALVDVLRMNGFEKKALRDVRPYTDRIVQSSELAFPLEGRWKALEDITKHHQIKSFAVYALDLVKLDDKGRHHKSRGKRLKDHYAWDQPVYAAADGICVQSIDGKKDHKIGKAGKFNDHNGVAIQHENGEISFYIHLKEGSIVPKLHEPVKKGQEIGRVGNSGASGKPHLHIAIVKEGGVVSIPMWFSEYELLVDPDHDTTIPVERGRIYEGDVVVGPERGEGTREGGD